MKQYLISWFMQAVYLVVGLFILWAGLQVIVTEQGLGVFMIAGAGAMFTFTYVMLWSLVTPIVRWVRGNIKGQPYYFRERLR